MNQNTKTMLSLKHKKLIVYQRSIELVTEVYAKTEMFPNEEKFSLASQLRMELPVNRKLTEKGFTRLQDPHW